MGMARWRRLTGWLTWRRRADELAAEIEDHRARLQAALEADGLPAAEATARSRRAMGNITLAREDARDVWISRVLDGLRRDVAYGIRGLRREPTFALTALLTLTLGCVTTTTVFSVVDAELWRPLPFPDARQLVQTEIERPGARFDRISVADLEDWNAQSRLAEYAGIQSGGRRVLSGTRPESVTVRPVTTNFFTVLRLSPPIGRGFTAHDDRARAAIVSDTAWHRLFDADRGIVGRIVMLDGQPYAVVGVLANTRLEFMSAPDFFVTIDPSSPEVADRQALTLDTYGRVRPGVAIAQAEAELRTIQSRIAAMFPKDRANQIVHLHDLQEYSTGFNWRQMYFFLAGAALVMLLSCLNVAGLLLARALRRQREFAIRGALGGGTAALLRQLVVEGAVLAIPGAAIGAVATLWLVRAFMATVPAGLLERGGQIAVDMRAGMFVMALSLVTTIALALSPVIFVRRVELSGMLGQGTRTAGRSPRQRAVRTSLLVAQVTTTLVLLAGAGLFVLSFARLAHTPIGFDPRDRVLLRIALPQPRYAADAQIIAFADRLLEQARGVAGVRDVAVGTSSPLAGGGPAVFVVVPDRPRPAPGSEPLALIFSASPTYFQTLGIRLVEGREFGASDVVGGPRVAIVNERLARALFPGEDAVGRTLEITPRGSRAWASRPGLVTIVGVVGNVKNFSVSEVDFSDLYLPFAQAPAPDLELIAATAIPPASAVDSLKGAAARVDGSLPVTSVSFFAERLKGTLQGARFNLALIALFAVLAVILAAVGIYGSMACAIAERTREFGVRIALGARPNVIFGEALRESVRIGVIGSVFGALAVVTLAKILGSALYLVPGQHGGLLYHVSMTSPIALGSACMVLTAVSALAGLSPARQATRVDPLIVLRAE
jgi:putative ABC transport system permease protein